MPKIEEHTQNGQQGDSRRDGGKGGELKENTLDVIKELLGMNRKNKKERLKAIKRRERELVAEFCQLEEMLAKRRDAEMANIVEWQKQDSGDAMRSKIANQQIQAIYGAYHQDNRDSRLYKIQTEILLKIDKQEKKAYSNGNPIRYKEILTHYEESMKGRANEIEIRWAGLEEHHRLIRQGHDVRASLEDIESILAHNRLSSSTDISDISSSGSGNYSMT